MLGEYGDSELNTDSIGCRCGKETVLFLEESSRSSVSAVDL